MTDSPLATPAWAGFLQTIRFAPADDTARLVAADWLEETGRPELEAWGQFIRAQIEEAIDRPPAGQHPPADYCDCVRCRANRRSTQLYDRWGLFWSAHFFGALAANTSVTTPPARDYHRGFPLQLIATIEDFKVNAVPRAVSPFFERMTFPTVAVTLRDTTLGAGYLGLNCWRVFVTHECTYLGGELFKVKAEIRPHPDRGILVRTQTSVRLIERKHRFDRAVRAVVRDVMNNRRECFRNYEVNA